MKLEIRNKSAIHDDDLLEHAEHKALWKFDRFKRHIKQVTIRLEDVNGPKGGLDKSCHIVIKGEFGTKIVETLDIDFYIAVDRALEKAEHSLRRLVERNVLESKQLRHAMNEPA